MSELYENDLRAWLAHRDVVARGATVPDRVVAGVEARTLERPGRGVRGTRLALVATGIAAVLLAGIGLPRALLRSHPSEPATAAAPGGNIPDRRPPAGVALVWVPDPADYRRIIALDHAGRPVGWLPVQGPLPEGSIEQSGDGQRLVLTDYDHASLMEVTAQGDRITLPATSQRTGPATFQTWNLFFSDDDRSLCLEQGEQGTLRPLVIIDAAGHAVHRIPEAPAGSPSYLSWHVMTCSVRNDVAVLVGRPDPQPVPEPTATAIPPATAGGLGMVSGASGQIRRVVVPPGGDHYVVRVVRLSTGAELARRTYAPSRPEPVDASEDGSLVLEREQALNAYTVRNIATGAPVSTLDGDVRGLLGNHLAIEQGPFTPPPAGSSQPVPIARMVVDITTGRTVWTRTLPPPSIGTVFYVSDVAVAVERHGAPGDRCTAWAGVEIADLATGAVHDTRLDTCPSG